MRVIRVLLKFFGLSNRGFAIRFFAFMYAKGRTVPTPIIRFFLKSRSFALPATSALAPQNMGKLKNVFLSLIENHGYSSTPLKSATVKRELLILLPRSTSENITRIALANEMYRLLSIFGFEVKLQEHEGQTPSLDFGCFTSADWLIIDSEFNQTNLEQIFTAIKAIRKFRSIKVAMVVYDLWRRRDLNIVAFSLDCVDLFLHMDNLAVDKYFSGQKESFKFWPITQVASQLLVDRCSSRSPTLFFSGRLMSDRLLVANEIFQFLKSTRFTPDFSFSDAHHFPLNESSYRKKLETSELSLSFTQRKVNHWIIPGRSLEILLSGSLLLQQEGLDESPLSAYLTPFEHYIPFTSVVELRNAVRLCSEHPDIVKVISSRGRAQTLKIITDIVGNSAFNQ